jgi:hypothetical protein
VRGHTSRGGGWFMTPRYLSTTSEGRARAPTTVRGQARRRSLMRHTTRSLLRQPSTATPRAGGSHPLIVGSTDRPRLVRGAVAFSRGEWAVLGAATPNSCWAHRRSPSTSLPHRFRAGERRDRCFVAGGRVSVGHINPSDALSPSYRGIVVRRLSQRAMATKKKRSCGTAVSSSSVNS